MQRNKRAPTAVVTASPAEQPVATDGDRRERLVARLIAMRKDMLDRMLQRGEPEAVFLVLIGGIRATLDALETSDGGVDIHLRRCYAAPLNDIAG